jgi:signal transduction histidine kinase
VTSLTQRHGGSKGRILAIGSLATLTLTVFFAGFSALDLIAYEDDFAITATALQSSQALSRRIGGELAEFESSAVEALTGSSGNHERSLSAIRRLDLQLTESVRDLEMLLRGDERGKWDALVAEIHAVRSELARVHTLDATTRPLLLARVAQVGQKIESAQDEVLRKLVQDSGAALGHVEQRMHRAWLVQCLLAAVCFAGIPFIWLRVYRLLRKKDCEIKRYVDQLEEKNRDLDAFAGRVSHDLRNALTPIRVSAELIAEIPLPAQEVAEVGTRISRAVERIDVIVSGLLAFARAQAVMPGKCSSVARVLAEVCDEIRDEAEQASVAVTTEVVDARVAMADSLLHQVLANVMHNGVKFLRGGSSPRLEVRAQTIDGRCEIEIEDNGPGMAPATLQRIFEPFFCGPDRSRAGIGIGLATAHRIVTSAGGTIGADSSPGRGTTFRICLPLSPPGGNA